MKLPRLSRLSNLASLAGIIAACNTGSLIGNDDGGDTPYLAPDKDTTIVISRNPETGTIEECVSHYPDECESIKEIERTPKGQRTYPMYYRFETDTTNPDIAYRLYAKNQTGIKELKVIFPSVAYEETMKPDAFEILYEVSWDKIKRLGLLTRFADFDVTVETTIGHHGNEFFKDFSSTLIDHPEFWETVCSVPKYKNAIECVDPSKRPK